MDGEARDVRRAAHCSNIRPWFRAANAVIRNERTNEFGLGGSNRMHACIFAHGTVRFS